jgi:outer membrane protein assembly factor BamB
MNPLRRSPLRLLPLVPCLLVDAAAADDWPQWRGPARDGAWRESGLIERLPEGSIPLRWRVAIGSGYSAPSVADGRVCVTDRVEEPEPAERVLAFDAATGAPLWSHAHPCSYEGISYDAGPRCAPLLHAGRTYTLGAAGHLLALDAASGAVIWSHDLRAEYRIDMPIWGIAASPLVEAGLLIVPVSGSDGACIVAFEAGGGAERWRALSDRGNYAAPIVIEQAGRRVLVCWTGDRIAGLDPRDGKILWAHPYPSARMPLGVATPVHADGSIFVTGFYDGCALLRLGRDELSVTEAWRRRGPNEIATDGLHSIISTPLMRAGHVYGVDSYGQLRCLDLADGSRVWEDTTAVPRARWATIHMVQNGSRTWMLNERGDLIVAELSPEGYRELSRTHLIDPTRRQLNERGGVVWAHPAFAGRHVFARNDQELVCASLEAAPAPARH